MILALLVKSKGWRSNP